MTAQDLKNSILQQAVQGKLIPQNPDDEPATELLKKISAERQKLIDEGKIKNSPPLPTISDDEKPFEIPKTWQWVRLGDIVQVKSSKRIFEKDYVTDGIPFFRSKEIGDLSRKEEIKTKIYISHSHYQNLKNNFGVPQLNDILVTSVGSIGNVWICDGREFYYKDGNIVQICNTPNLYSQYIAIFIKSPFFELQVSNSVTGTAYSALTIIKLKNIVFPLPPFAEQKRIVAKLEEILPLIERYGELEQRLTTLDKEFPDKLKKSLLQQAIQGKLTPHLSTDGNVDDLLKKIQAEKSKLVAEGMIKKEKPLPPISADEIPFEIPENWQWVRLGDLGNYKKGPFGSSLTKNIFVPKGADTIKVYEQKNAIQKNSQIGNYYITKKYFDEKMSGFETLPGDIIVSCAGTIGESYIMPQNIEKGIINQALMRMRISKPMDITFFLVVFDFILKQNSQSSSKGSAIKNIPPFDVFKNFLVPLPPLAEQQRIVEQLEELLPLCEKFRRF